jgi:hypothetical protein
MFCNRFVRQRDVLVQFARSPRDNKNLWRLPHFLIVQMWSSLVSHHCHINIFDINAVVYAGGGSAGCNTLYQLARRGVRAVLLEKARLTAGTTWHTAGLIWRLRPSDVEIELLAATRNLLMRLEAETGVDPGWVNNGGLFIAHTKVRFTGVQ